MERGVYELTPAPVDVLALLDNIAGELRGVVEAQDLALDIQVRGKPREVADTFTVRGEEMLLYTMLTPRGYAGKYALT